VPAPIIAVILAHVPIAGDVVAQTRPALVPHGITTRLIADSDTTSSNPTHLANRAYSIDTVCHDSYCVEEVRAGHRVLIAAASALAALQHEVADPGHEDEVDATEIVLPQPSAPGLLSVARLESNYAAGAAHANSSARCETYDVTTGKRLTLRDVVGARAARKIAAAAGHHTRARTTNLLVPVPGMVFLCDPELPDHTPTPDPIVLRVPR
jgi:hypothetical protein